ncbi:MAG: extracellular solute-binding protein [Anaerovoracaceae bacterium]
MLSTLTGCGQEDNIKGEKPVVSISMYNAVSFPKWRSYVENQCSEIHIKWLNNRNDAGKLLYVGQHDNMADIVAIRKFEEDTAKKLEPYLLDLSNFEQTKEIKGEYLDNFIRDGKVFWLPQPGAMDTLVVNVDLFQQYGIPIPTDLDSFISVCKKFESVGIRGFMADITENWGSDKLIKAIGLDPFFGREDGQAWEENVMKTGKYQEDIDGFAKVGEVLEELRDNKVITKKDLANGTLSQVTKMLYDGKLAMTILCTDTVFDRTNSLNIKGIPHLGKKEEDKHLLDYPVFSLGLSKKLDEDSQKLENAKKVLNAMMSPEAQKKLNEQGEGLVSYNKTKLEKSHNLKDLIPYVNEKNNHNRVLLQNSFKAAAKGLEEILVNNSDGEEFAKTYFLELGKIEKETYVGINKEDIDNSQTVDSEGDSTIDFNNPFASVIAQSVKEKTRADIALIDSRCATTPLFKGEYTDKQIKSIVDTSNLFIGNLKGKQIKDVIRESIYCSNIFEYGNIEPLIYYPAVGGATIYNSINNPVEKLKDLGKRDIKDNEEYKVIIDIYILYALEKTNNQYAKEFFLYDGDIQSIFIDNWKEKGTLPTPKDYFVKVEGNKEDDQ